MITPSYGGKKSGTNACQSLLFETVGVLTWTIQRIYRWEGATDRNEEQRTEVFFSVYSLSLEKGIKIPLNFVFTLLLRFWKHCTFARWMIFTVYLFRSVPSVVIQSRNGLKHLNLDGNLLTENAFNMPVFPRLRSLSLQRNKASVVYESYQQCLCSLILWPSLLASHHLFSLRFVTFPACSSAWENVAHDWNRSFLSAIRDGL